MKKEYENAQIDFIMIDEGDDIITTSNVPAKKPSGGIGGTGNDHGGLT